MTGETCLEGRGVLDSQKTLRRLEGDGQFLNLLYKTFLDTLDERIANLAEGVEKGDMKSLCKLAHTLKGAASTIDAELVRQKALDVETTARQEDTAAARKAYEELMGEVARLEAELKNRVAGN